MLSEILYLYAAKRQYDIQKEAGLAGLIGLVSVFLIILNWENLFYPFMEAIGLVEIAEKGGLIDSNPIQTFINIFVMSMFFLLSLGFAMALPMLIVMTFFAVLGGASNAPSPIAFALGLVILPFMLIVYGITKLLGHVGLIKPIRSVTSFANSNAEMKSALARQELRGNVKPQALLELYSIQETQKSSELTYEEITVEEAEKVLNRAIPSLENNTEYLFGYNEQYQSWYMLFPNPVPVFASQAILNTTPELSPFNYEQLSLDYFAFISKSWIGEKPKFYVPACQINLSFDEANNKIHCSLNHDSFGLVTCVDTLTKVVKVTGPSATKLYKEAIKKSGVQLIVERSHAYAYLIPLAYPNEVKIYENPENEHSYYKALEQVPGASDLVEYYKPVVLDALRNKAMSGHKWASDLWEQIKSNNNGENSHLELEQEFMSDRNRR